MVTFVCRHCDATLKKKQTENHRCRPTSFICIDCHKTFTGQDFKAHTSCLTQFEKHWGEYAKPKQKSQQNAQNNVKPQQTAKPVQEQKVENGEEQQHSGEGWKGWKNEIKTSIRQSSERLRVDDLKQKVLKRFKEFQPSSDLKDEQLQAMFVDKLGKLKKVKLVTYVETD